MVNTIDLVGYWKLDDNTNTTNIINEEGVDATKTGGNSEDDSVAGKIGNAQDFTPTGDRIALGTILNNGEFSFSLWFDRDVIGAAEQIIISKWKDSGNRWALRLDGSQNLLFFDGGWNTVVASTSAGWHHVVVTADSGGWELWYDGTSVDSGAGTFVDISFDTALAAFSGGTSGSYNGGIDEVGIWEEYKLTNTEIADLYNSGNGLAYPFSVATTRKIKIAGTFQDKPIKTKVGGTFVDKPIKIKVGGTFQDA